MDAQSICHNSSQLIIPQENHRTFVSVYNWICAAEVRQPHNPACNSHLCFPGARKAPSLPTGNTEQRQHGTKGSVSPHFLLSLSCQEPSGEKCILIQQTKRWIILFVKYLAASKVSRV